MKRHLASKAVVAATLLTAAAAVPAEGTVRERLRITDTYTYSYDCGFPVDVSGKASDVIILREDPQSDGQAFPVLDRWFFREVHTNADTGEWFTIERRATFNEVEANHVEGTIWEFRVIEGGQHLIVRNSDGDVVSRNRGNIKVTYLFDTLGDGQPGGEWVGDLSFDVTGPHPDIERDLCGIATDMVG